MGRSGTFPYRPGDGRSEIGGRPNRVRPALLSFLIATLFLIVPSAALGHTAPIVAPGGPPPAHAMDSGTPPSWFNLSSSEPSPSGRTFASATFDAAFGVTVIFGGQASDGTPLGDLWVNNHGAWTHLDAVQGLSPAPRWGASLVYDSATGSTILFGGQNSTTTFADVWSLNDSGWHRLYGTLSPGPRAFGAAAFDPTLGGILYFGGSTNAAGAPASNDTWLLQNGLWTNLSHLGTTPPPLVGAAATYDAADGIFLLFGGRAGGPSGAQSAGTWGFSRAGWSNLSLPGALSPAPRYGASLAFDPQVGFSVLFGGSVGAHGESPAFPSDTWAFAHGFWQDRTTISGVPPAGREGAVLVDDLTSQGLTLFGGDTGSSTTAQADTWHYSSQALEITVTATPTAGSSPLNVSFSLSVVGGSPPYQPVWTFGDGLGEAGSFHLNHIYPLPGNYSASVVVTDSVGDSAVHSVPIAVLTAWEGSHQWANIGASLTTVPSQRAGAQMAYDPALQGVILFGGRTGGGIPLGDTWEFVNNLWIDLTPTLSSAPSARWGGALVYDAADATLILFGGATSSGTLNDTWSYDGTGWRSIATASAPSPRAFAQADYDVGDGVILLFGGGDISPAGIPRSVSADTWEYRAGQWQNITSQLVIAPPPTLGGSASWDPTDASVILFGGSSVSATGAPGTCYPDASTWSFAGGVWTSTGGTGPGGRVLTASAYDSTDHVLLLFGGATAGAASTCRVSSDTWSYVGGGWTNLSGVQASPPPPRDSAAMTYDGAEGVVLLFGGSDNGLLLNDTWVYPAVLNDSATSNTGNSSSGGGSSGGSGGSTGGNGGTGNNDSGGGTSSNAPVFSVGYTLSSVTSVGPLTVTFVGTALGGVGPYTFAWYFGDSTPTLYGATVSHRYTTPGSYEPVLTATDGSGAQLVRVLASITIAPAPAGGTVVSPVGPSGASPGSLSFGFLGLGSIVLVALVVVYGRKEWRLVRAERSLDDEFA